MIMQVMMIKAIHVFEIYVFITLLGAIDHSFKVVECVEVLVVVILFS